MNARRNSVKKTGFIWDIAEFMSPEASYPFWRALGFSAEKL
jgi:hypothetical protein